MDSLVAICRLSCFKAWGSQSPNQRSNPHPLHCKANFNHWTSREVPAHLFLYSVMYLYQHELSILILYLVYNPTLLLVSCSDCFFPLTPCSFDILNNALLHPGSLSICVSTRLDRTFDTETEPRELKPYGPFTCVSSASYLVSEASVLHL